MLARMLGISLIIVASLPVGQSSLASQANGADREIGPVMASWYGDGYDGRRTASGERFDPDGFTAAHPDLPLGTVVAVRRWSDGRVVVVRINDRGPSHLGRGIDLSEAAARRLGLIADGTGLVTLHPLDPLDEAD